MDRNHRLDQIINTKLPIGIVLILRLFCENCVHTIIEVNIGLKSTVQIGKEPILESIKRYCSELDDVSKISKRDYFKKEYAVSDGTIRRYFRTWTAALKEAGFEKDKEPTVEELKKQIIDSLLKYREQNGTELTRDDFANKSYGFSRSQIERAFGSWTKALAASRVPNKYEENNNEKSPAYLEIINAIKKFIEEEGEECSFNAFSVKSYAVTHFLIKKHFNSWEEAYDFARFGESLLSRKELQAQYGLPENFLRGFHIIPEVREKLVYVGKNKKQHAVYKIPSNNIDFVVNFYNDLYSLHKEYSVTKGWFTLGESLKSVYFTQEIISKMISDSTLIECEDYVTIDRINFKGIPISTASNKDAKITLLHRRSFVKFPNVTIGTLVKTLKKMGLSTTDQMLWGLVEKGILTKTASFGFDNAVVDYYNVEQTIKTVTHYLTNMDRTKWSGKLASFDFLNEFQQEIIETYISDRANGVVIDFNGYRTKRNVAHSELRLPELRNRIANVFFSIICGRCEINYQNGDLEKIDEEELERFNPDVFKITDVTLADYRALSKGRKTNTLIQRYADLKVFYYWLLWQEDEKEKKSFEEYQAFDSLKKRIYNFLSQFPRSEHDAPVREEIKKIVKVFLTHEELIQCRDLLLKLHTHRPLNALRYATVWMLSANGIRPEEFVHLQLDKHFVLGEDGLMVLNDKGYGEMIIDGLVAKGEYSTSHRIYKLPVPKDTVEQVNKYLKALYSKQGPANPVGKGYFIRSHPMAAEVPMKELSKEFIIRLRKNADFLSKEKREHLELKTGRRSMNTIMKKTYIEDKILRENVKYWAMHYQMRHEPEENPTNPTNTKSMGDQSYLQDITRDEYYGILDQTINFPWDMSAIKKWKYDRGIISKEEFVGLVDYEINEETKDKNETVIEEEIDNELKIELQKQKEELEQQLKKLKTRPKGMTLKEWSDERKQLQKMLDIIKLKLKL
jgi:hypothetical protein